MVKINFKIVVLFVWVISFLALSVFFIKRKSDYTKILNKKGRYTVGVTKGWIRNHRSSKFSINYEFTHNRKSYRNVEMVTALSDINTNEGMYLVVYDIENPKNSKLLLSKHVCKVYIDNFMDTGWIDYKKYVTLCQH
jgi:hypothetical protein